MAKIGGGGPVLVDMPNKIRSIELRIFKVRSVILKKNFLKAPSALVLPYHFPD